MRKLSAFVILLLLVVGVAVPVFADGNGSPQECTNLPRSVDGSVASVPEGYVITAICIKSGSGTFGGVTHSNLITVDGVYSGYTVSGIGTSTVTVDQGNQKDVSHIDFRKIGSDTTTTSSTSSTSTTIVDSTTSTTVADTTTTSVVDTTTTVGNTTTTEVISETTTSAPERESTTTVPEDTTTVFAENPEEPSTTAIVCTEDMECWDCETMGNKLCGPQITELPFTGISTLAKVITGAMFLLVGASLVLYAVRSKDE